MNEQGDLLHAPQKAIFLTVHDMGSNRKCPNNSCLWCHVKLINSLGTRQPSECRANSAENRFNSDNSPICCWISLGSCDAFKNLKNKSKRSSHANWLRARDRCLICIRNVLTQCPALMTPSMIFVTQFRCNASRSRHLTWSELIGDILTKSRDLICITNNQWNVNVNYKITLLN